MLLPIKKLAALLAIMLLANTVCSQSTDSLESNASHLTITEYLTSEPLYLSNGMTEDDANLLASLVLGFEAPTIELFHSSSAQPSQYYGVRITSVLGESVYITINDSNNTEVIDILDKQVPTLGLGFGVLLTNFTQAISIDSFGGEIVLNGQNSSFSFKAAYEWDAPHTYYFYKTPIANITADILLNGAYKILGNSSNNRFDFSGITANQNSVVYINGGAGSDELIGPNVDTKWEIALPAENTDPWLISEQTYPSVVTISIQNEIVARLGNIENLTGGTGANAFNLTTSFDGSINGGANSSIFFEGSSDSGTTGNNTGSCNSTESSATLTSGSENLTVETPSACTISISGELIADAIKVGELQFNVDTSSVVTVNNGQLVFTAEGENLTTTLNIQEAPSTNLEINEGTTEQSVTENNAIPGSDSSGGGSLHYFYALLLLGLGIIRRK
ncbi:hypothetical protein [Teredinibacter sp. KSP-S5-2]|uniref:hypothetical protein n=1 Tax=Teredinibacter sp. KSP-S5-2 TaxID=3034506 RepID=UPI0029344236|nr:hypothetical protein [Teredinibacter sp. KSP-S5-2]WNO07749.1 hypothetical protein P5V12_12190 [Teredinibacter sp. KSP-S5-2]